MLSLHAHHVFPYSILVLTQGLFNFIASLPTGAYLEEQLDQPLDLSIKRAVDFKDSDCGSTSSGSSCSNDDPVDEECDKSNDQRLYSLLQEDITFNGKKCFLLRHKHLIFSSKALPKWSFFSLAFRNLPEEQEHSSPLAILDNVSEE